MKKLFALLLGVGLLTLACAPAAQPAPPAEKGPTGQPKPGGVLRLSGGGSSYSGIDPAMGQASYNVWPIISEYILRLDPATWEVLPGVAEKWEFSPDGKELTLYLRKGVKFFNKPPVSGREVEAKDVVYTLKTITGQLYPDLPSVRFPRRSNLEGMVDAVAVDKYTVKITLTGPSATFILGLAEYRSAIVLPEGLRESFGDIQSLASPHLDRYISAGPFIMTKFTDLVEVEYERNPEYWDKGKPYLNKIRAVWMDASTAQAAFIAGQIDSVGIANPPEREFLLSQKADTKIEAYAPSSCWYRLAFNLTRKPWDDVRLRKALALVLDPVQAGEQFHGKAPKQLGDLAGKPLWRYPGPIPWVFPESLSQEELAKMPYYESPKSEKTLAEARKLLADAGYPKGFEFEMLTMANLMEDYALLAKSQIEKGLPGMKANVKIVDNAIRQKAAAEGNFETDYYCYIHEASGVAMFKTPYDTKGGRNYARYSNSKVDQLAAQASRELDIEKRKALLREAQLIVLDEVPFIPTFHNYGLAALQPYVMGMRYGSATTPAVWYKEVWLDK